QALAALDALELLLEALAQQHAVGEIRQRVVARHVRDALLGELALGDVLVGGEPADAGDRLVDERDDASVRELDRVARGLALPEALNKAGDVILRIAGEASGRGAQLEQIA